MKPPVAYAIDRIRGLAGPGPYEVRQSDRSALAQSMAADVDPLNAMLADYWRGLVGQGQGSGWFGMNTVPQELTRLGDIRRQSGGLNPEYGAALFDSPLAPGFGVMATVDDVGKAAGNVVEGITAYHGSPHTFDRFDMSKIGTGEGAQAYGHGLYFAEAEDVARSYKGAGPAARDNYRVVNDRLRELAREMSKIEGGRGYRNFSADPERGAALAAEYDRLLEERTRLGSMYEVRINASPDDFIDFDVPLSQQSEKVKAALQRFRLTGEVTDGMPLGSNGRLRIDVDPEMPEYPKYFMVLDGGVEFRLSPRDLKNFIAQSEDEIAGRNILSTLATQLGSENAAAAALREAGVPGIKYLDAGSRTAGDGSRNYVVFDDKLIEILRRYGLLPPLAAGGAAMLGGNEAEAGQ